MRGSAKDCKDIFVGALPFHHMMGVMDWLEKLMESL